MMGVKFWNLQMISWCFQVMGSHGSCLQLPDHMPAEPRTVKLIRSDGVVKVFHRPVRASELMLEFPKHLICHSDSFYIGQKIPALSADEDLQLGHKYFLLPQHFFQSVLSFVTLASFASSSSRLVKNVAGIRPFEILKKPGGSLQIRVSDEFISKLIEGDNVKDEEEASVKEQPKGKVCTTPALQKDYTQLVGYRSQQWKPKLETIRELEKNGSRFGGAFGIKRRKRVVPKGAQKLQKSEAITDQEKKL
ncbi:uncharacterized protein LOC116257783 [Nymphaea colorata]|nr:uncharacterized protein LOC116257783 [Nymphaea colorata]